MTALTTILGLIPLAVGGGEGAEIRNPLALTVIGGLAVSTLMTLIVVPVIYSFFEEIRGRSDKDLE
jgi:HAE1 family hydrophobic/amphiphilic exporter-1